MPQWGNRAQEMETNEVFIEENKHKEICKKEKEVQLGTGRMR